MMDITQFKARVAALRKHDKTLTEAEAGAIAAEIGDEPLLSGGLVYATRGGQPYTIPAAVLFGKDYEQ